MIAKQNRYYLNFHILYIDSPKSHCYSQDIKSNKSVCVPHQWCALFYRLLHIEKVEGGERDTQLVHVNEATAV
jgi:hypothetical protein